METEKKKREEKERKTKREMERWEDYKGHWPGQPVPFSQDEMEDEERRGTRHPEP